jgi:hypothetical protein
MSAARELRNCLQLAVSDGSPSTKNPRHPEVRGFFRAEGASRASCLRCCRRRSFLRCWRRSRSSFLRRLKLSGISVEIRGHAKEAGRCNGTAHRPAGILRRRAGMLSDRSTGLAAARQRYDYGSSCAWRDRWSAASRRRMARPNAAAHRVCGARGRPRPAVGAELYTVVPTRPNDRVSTGSSHSPRTRGSALLAVEREDVSGALESGVRRPCDRSSQRSRRTLRPGLPRWRRSVVIARPGEIGALTDVDRLRVVLTRLDQENRGR